MSNFFARDNGHPQKSTDWTALLLGKELVDRNPAPFLSNMLQRNLYCHSSFFLASVVWLIVFHNCLNSEPFFCRLLVLYIKAKWNNFYGILLINKFFKIFVCCLFILTSFYVLWLLQFFFDFSTSCFVF